MMAPRGISKNIYFYIIYIFEGQEHIERGREREVFHLLVHYQNGPMAKGWVRLKQEGLSSTGAQVPESSSIAFPDTTARSWIRNMAAWT